jgi:hypothetical protein
MLRPARQSNRGIGVRLDPAGAEHVGFEHERGPHGSKMRAVLSWISSESGRGYRDSDSGKPELSFSRLNNAFCSCRCGTIVFLFGTFRVFTWTFRVDQLPEVATLKNPLGMEMISDHFQLPGSFDDSCSAN